MGETKGEVEISESIKKWDDESFQEESKTDLANDLYDHFEKTKLRNWPEIANEARRVWNEMFDEKIEEDSPIDSLLAAACSQVEHGVIEAMSRMMSVDEKDLQSAISYWIEMDGEPYVPINSPELNNLISQVKKDEEGEEK